MEPAEHQIDKLAYRFLSRALISLNFKNDANANKHDDIINIIINTLPIKTVIARFEGLSRINDPSEEPEMAVEKKNNSPPFTSSFHSRVKSVTHDIIKFSNKGSKARTTLKKNQ
jgi:hypothetical protein